MKLYIARHGESIGNQLGVIQGQRSYSLTRLGVEQSHLLGLLMKGVGVGKIIASDLPRALETANIIEAHVQSKCVEFTSLLRERKYGDLEGTLADGKEAPLPRDAENLDDFLDRVRKALDLIIGGGDAQKVLMVSHGGTICAIVSILLNSQFNTTYRMSSMANGSITIFDPVPNLVLFSGTQHLEGLNY